MRSVALKTLEGQVTEYVSWRRGERPSSSPITPAEDFRRTPTPTPAALLRELLQELDEDRQIGDLHCQLGCACISPVSGQTSLSGALAMRAHSLPFCRESRCGAAG